MMFPNLLKCLRRFTVLTAMLFLTHPIYAQIVTDQRDQLFDADWRFHLGDSPEAKDLSFNDSDWRKLDLPHDWSIEGKLDSRNPMGGAGGFFPAGMAWYRKTFEIPANFKDKQVSVYFEGIYMNAEVFINGRSLGIQPYGYTSFSRDLSPYLRFGSTNVIAVKVDNSKQINSRWYSGSGIYRHVKLNVTDKIHLGQWGVQITTPQVSAQRAMVALKIKVKNETSKAQTVVIASRLLGKKKASANQTKTEVLIAAGSEKEITQSIVLQRPELWSIKMPNLYQARVEISQKGKLLDQVGHPFGVRTIAYSTEKGFALNGRSMKINGGCVHHDNGCLGAAAYDRAEERKVELLKAAGFNTVRTSHNPPSEAFLDACDRLGLLVIDESFDGWRTGKNTYDYARYFDQWWRKDIDAMVQRDRNHPSIIMWSIGNEIIERKEAQAVETAKLLAKEVRLQDPTRPVTSAMTTWDNDWAIFDPLMAAHDIAGYNYQMHHAEKDHERVPSRIILQTESYPRDAFYNWKMVQKHSYIIGDIVWAAMDYLGESAIGRYYYPGEPSGEHWERNWYPWHGAYCGDIDLIGWRKPISHYRDMLYNDDNKLYLAVKEPNPASGPIKETMWAVWPTWESWTWPGFESKEIQVEVYSKYPKVRLYLDEKLIGEKETTEKQEFKATFPVAYQKGKLRAVGLQNNKVVEEKILNSAGETYQIRLTSDRKKLKANGQDLAFVNVEVLDRNGIHQPNAENELTFAVSGQGSIAGVDNANLKDEASYVGNSRKAWKGRAMVVVKSTHQNGVITLTVNSSGLKGATVTIPVVQH